MEQASYIIKVQTDKRNRFIGKLNTKTNVFYKEVIEEKHLFRKFDAWGIDAKFFNDILLPKNCTIHIFDKMYNVDYYILSKDFKKHSRHFHFIEDEDNQAQIFCSRNHFAMISRDY